MAHTYTPGLRVTRRATIRKRRQLPLAGEVLVSDGESVQRDRVVARTELPGDVTTLNLVNRLGVTPDELPDFMLRKEGEPVDSGEPLAETRPIIKWFKTTVESPVSGTVESVSPVTGQAILRGPPRPVQVRAYVDGTVVETIPGEGVVIETAGAFLQGIFGIGGESWGAIHTLAAAPDERLREDRIDAACAGRICIAGGLVTLDLIQKAREIGAAGLIGGGIRDRDLRSLLGYDLGVAITGAEEIGLTVVVTEGFGDIAMASKTFDVLNERNGEEASISGATQIRAGVLRPEIIVPDTASTADAEESVAREGLSIGDPIRTIRAPFFGNTGVVTALPSELAAVESEIRVRVLEVQFENGQKAVIPRANAERIEA
ncbi:MAG: hypothetical protein OXU79_01810 [Gemmatimonadota bacterium]|nr:hypothetical protein [Gemmatimonadota bacterium]